MRAIDVEIRLARMGLEIPPPAEPVGSFAAAVQAGSLLFVSGQGPLRGGQFLYLGKVDSEVSVDEAVEASRHAALNCLAAAKDFLGDLERVIRIVKLTGFVNSDPQFDRHPEVMNGASDLLIALFGSIGRHARSSVGVAALPMRIPVEVEMVLEVARDDERSPA